MARGPVLDLHEGELWMTLYRHGKKRFQLFLQKDDATKHAWKIQEIPLPFGAVKAHAAALAYWELWKIKEGVSDGNQ